MVRIGGSHPPDPGSIPGRGKHSFFCVHLYIFVLSAGLTYTTLAPNVPPELRWQSGRLLTDRSLVRSQVVAFTFIFSARLGNNLILRPNPRHHEPMAQRQRVGFQTRRLGVQIPLGSLVIFWFCPYAQNAHNTHPRRVPLYAVFIDPKVTYLAGA